MHSALPTHLRVTLMSQQQQLQHVLDSAHTYAGVAVVMVP